MKWIILLTAVMSSSAFAKRDILTHVTNLECSGGNHKVQVNWNSAAAPLAPHTFKLDGTNIASGMRMSLGDDQETYESQGLKFSFTREDIKAKAFKTKAMYNGQDLDLDCKIADDGYKLFHKREETQAAPADPASPGGQN